jgi:hypothetical protein
MVNPPSLGDFSTEELVKGRTIESDLIDYGILRNWISSCQREHSTCRGPKSMPLKLIDCRKRTIESLQGHVPYVALSYVWGKRTLPGHQPACGELLPSNLPTTIEDAIRVTVELHYDYLWIDRYCIDQHGEEKATEIGRMDEIYQGAEVVIIDAAGEDPTLGLAGVSRIRNPQPRIFTGAHTIVSLFRYPLNNVRSSKLASRGWTYQEAVLAKRRLFFTEDQVYFECHVHSYMETLDKALVHRETGAPSLVPRDLRSHRGKLPTLLQYLEEYSKRELTYPSDALNAFLGVLRAFEKQESPVRHYWGVPILRTLSSPASEPVSALQGFLRGLCWSSSEATTTRRSHFPSWSWTGWDCSGRGVIYHSAGTPLSCSLTRLRVSLSDELLDWPDFWARREQEVSTVKFYAQSLPSRLHIKGRVVEFQGSRDVADCNHTSGFRELRLGNTTQRAGEYNTTSLVRAYLQQVPAGLQTFTAVVLGEAPVILDKLSSMMVGGGRDFERISELGDEEDTESTLQPRDSDEIEKMSQLGDWEEVESMSEPNYVIMLLLLREQHDTTPPALPTDDQIFERVGLLELRWRSSQDYEHSNWFLEATERDIVVL